MRLEKKQYGRKARAALGFRLLSRFLVMLFTATMPPAAPKVNSVDCKERKTWHIPFWSLAPRGASRRSASVPTESDNSRHVIHSLDAPQASKMLTCVSAGR